MSSIIAWIILGALAGWIASIIMKTNASQGAIGNIVTGIVGAFIGGFIYRALTGSSAEGLVPSLLTAIVGAVILIAAMKALRRNTSHA